MTVLTGFIYPLIITGIGQVVFPGKANGSLIYKDNQVVGSSLIGQKFDSSIYFWSRPSAIDYNPLPSSGSNFGPTSEKLKGQRDDRFIIFIRANGLKETADVPGDMLFASGSGLDPHISRMAALMQVDRIVKARNLNDSQKTELLQLIDKITEKPQYTFLGNERVNVLLLNIELDKLK